MSIQEKYPQYYKNVDGLKYIDVYRVLSLFEVIDPCAQHAIKKLLLSGVRTGGKDYEKDIREARDTLDRLLQMIDEGKPIER